jgi:hypothetical protein
MNKRLQYFAITVGLLVVFIVFFMRGGMFERENEHAVPSPTVQKLIDRSEPRRPPTDKAEESENLSRKMSDSFVAGGRAWTLSFADRSLTPEIQSRIIYDFNLVFGHLSKSEVDRLDHQIKTPQGRYLDRRVRFEGGSRKWNSIFQGDEFGCLFKDGSETEVFVPQLVTNAYLKSIALEKTYASAFSGLDLFLTKMSRISSHPIEKIRDLFVCADDFKSVEADLDTISSKDFIEAWGRKIYRQASILDITETAGTQFEQYGPLAALTYANVSGKLEDLPPLILSNGQWRFLLQRPPT